MNGNLWIVSNKKWREIKEKSITIKLKIDSKYEKYIENISAIGEFNVHPIFIKTIHNNKLGISIEVISLPSYLEVFTKKLKLIKSNK